MSYHRIFQVFGEGEQESRLWPSLRAAALAGRDYPMTPGEQVRDFTPVELVASHFADELERPAPPFGDPVIRHVAAGNPCTTKGFAEYWWRKWGATGHLLPGALPYRLGEVMRYVPELTPCT